MRLFATLILSMTAAFWLMTACMTLLPGDVSERLVWSGLLFPLLWPLLMFYASWPEKAYWPVAVLGGATLAPVLLFVLS